MDWSLTFLFGLFRLPLSFFEICLKCALATVFLTGNGAERTQMTLLICKLFLNANKHMCSSLKSVKIATFAVGVRRRTRLISYPDFSRPSGRETSYFKWRHAYSCKQLLRSCELFSSLCFSQFGESLGTAANKQ